MHYGPARTIATTIAIGLAVAAAGCGSSSASKSSSASAPKRSGNVRTVANTPTADPAAFEQAIMTVFNKTTGTDSVNGVSPKVTAVACPATASAFAGAEFRCGVSGPGSLTGNVTVTVTSSEGAFFYKGNAQMLIGSTTAQFPLSAHGALAGTSTPPASPSASSPGSAAFENAIMTAFNSTTGTNSVNGISPKVTTVTCPSGISASVGASFNCGLVGPGQLTGSVKVTVKSAEGKFTYKGNAQMVAGSTNATFPLSGQATA
jgi:adenosylcobinamide amidohydrolase